MVKSMVRIYCVCLSFTLLLAACQPIQVPAKPQGAQRAPRPDAPPYAVHGPFAVGYKPLVIGEGTDHPLDGSLWYPALNPTGRKEEVTYAIKLKDSSWSTNLPKIIYGHALLNADIDADQGPYPLVVWSPGFAANAAWTSDLLEHYASYGFIILSPEHTEGIYAADFAANPLAFSDFGKTSIDRPRDIKATLDFAEQLTAPGGALAGLIDMQHVAVAGHSYGGYSALAMAGAQFDLAALNARCAELPADAPNKFNCNSIVPKEAEMAARAGLDPMPQGLWPAMGDARVTAILPMSGNSSLFDKAGLAKITIPMMAMQGSADSVVTYDWGAKPAYDYASSTQKSLVTFIGGDHLIFATSCENEPWMLDHPAYGAFCFDPVWDKARALDLINHFSTAFLLDTLKGDKAAHAALLPDAVSFPGVEYATTLK